MDNGIQATKAEEARAVAPRQPVAPPRAEPGRVGAALSPAVDLSAMGRAASAASAYGAARATPTRIVGPRDDTSAAAGPGKFPDTDTARAYAQSGFQNLSSAVSQVNRVMASIGPASVGRYLARGGIAGEEGVRAMASALRDANTRVEVAVRRLVDAFQVTGTVTVRMADGTLQMGAFTLSFSSPSGDGTMHSPAASDDRTLDGDSEELGSGAARRPGSSLDLRV